MIRAYNQLYVDDAMETLGETIDYALNECAYHADEFMYAFLLSGYAKRFEEGEVSIISGRSGLELARDIILATRHGFDFPKKTESFDYNKEYWAGWVLAYYQWYTAMSFRQIEEVIPLEKLISLYYPLHEASIEKVIDVLDDHWQHNSWRIGIQERRKRINLTQADLAKRAGISKRTLEEYENGSRSINKASAFTLFCIAKALSCPMNELIIYEPDNQN